MLVRLPLAFTLGLTIYMVAMVMTVYDGPLSLIFQPLIGAVLTGLALLSLCAVASPLLLPRVWTRWRHVGWLPLVITVAGIASFVASWHPSLRVKVLDPETQTMVDSFHPVLSVAGWLAAMFGVAFCPALGLRGDRRWI